MRLKTTSPENAYGRYEDDPDHIGCPREKSDMTPCIARDGHLAESDDKHCVGCNTATVDIFSALIREFGKADILKAAVRQLTEGGDNGDSNSSKEVTPA